MPVAAVATYSGKKLDPISNPEDARLENINLAAGTYQSGQLVGEITGTPGTYGSYASGNVNGSQLPTHILQYAVVVDASGNVSFGDTAGGDLGFVIVGRKGVPAFRCGYFSCADLVGLDANAVTALRARLTQGTVSAGRVMIPGS